jgi:hypothetical protein
MGEHKTNMLESPAMARRPERNEEAVLTRVELKQLQKRLESYDWAAREAYYRSAHNRCSLQPRWIPSPKAMQELIAAWKALRRGPKVSRMPRSTAVNRCDVSQFLTALVAGHIVCAAH